MVDLEAGAIRHMYQTHPASFFRLAFHILHPGVEYLHNWPIDVLGDALERCHRRETKRLIINMPPRSLKSMCASVAFPAWVLGIRPETKIVCVAGHRGLAGDQHALTRQLMAHPKYRGLFPHIRFTETPTCLRLPHGGSRGAFTPTGRVTGRGADLIIIDDPQAANDVDDPKKLASVTNWYDRNIYQRLDDKNDGVIVVVMQRLAHDDLTAHLLAQGGWELLNLPAIATEDEKFPGLFGDRPVRRKGEALNPRREDREQLREAMLRMGARTFMAQYQQQPYPPGQGGERGGAFTLVPHPNVTEEDLANGPLVFMRVPEETFVRERVFGEFSGVLPGSPQMTAKQWFDRYGGQIHRN